MGRLARVKAFTLGATVLLMVGHPVESAHEAVLFTDGFEHGTANWTLDSGWGIAFDSGNQSLRGEGHALAMLTGGAEPGTITRLEHRFKLVAGTASTFFRMGPPGTTTRYLVEVSAGRLRLGKKASVADPKYLADVAAPVAIGTWQTLTIASSQDRIEIFLDGTQRIEVTDDDDPITNGTIAFECGDGSVFNVDDIVLSGAPLSGLIWQPAGGPRGGIGYDVRFDPRDPGVAWASDAFAGVHKSIDGGTTWTPRNRGITVRTGFAGDAIPIFSLEIDGHHPDTLWVGTQGKRGIFKSTNGGEFWTEMDVGVEDKPILETRSFCVDPTNSDVVYSGGNYMADFSTQRQRGVIYKTTDGGRSWRLLIEPRALVRWIVVDPSQPRTVYAATGIFDRRAVAPEGVLKSTDGGSTWVNVNTGLESLVVGGLAMDPTDPRALIAVTGKHKNAFVDDPSDGLGGVFKTNDGGQHWRRVDPFGSCSGCTRQVTAVAYAPSDPRIVYADTGGIFMRSMDGGDHWESWEVETAGENRGVPISLAVHPANPDVIFMNAYTGGVFVSRDGGHGWADSSRGYCGSQAWDVATDPHNRRRVVVASMNGVHASDDGGLTWVGRITDNRLNSVLSAAVDPSEGDTWLVGNQINGRIWRTTDAGDSWTVALPPLGEDTMNGRRSTFQIVFAPSDPRLVFAATGVALFGVPASGNGPGIFRSTDGGQTWLAVNAGLESTTLTATALAVHPQDARIVYAGIVGAGVFRSTDAGQSWSASSGGLVMNEIRSLAIDPAHPETVFAGGERAGVWKSTDAGATWVRASHGIEPEASVRSIVVDPVRPGWVYAGDIQSGVYRSCDAGSTWSLINAGLRNRAINRLAITRDGSRLFVATEGGGVFWLDLPHTGMVRRHFRRT